MIKKIGVAVLLALLAGFIEIISDDYSAPATYGFIGFTVVLASVLFLLFTRLATVVDATGLVVKGFFTTRRVPWSRIQEIIVEANPSHYTEERHPKEIAVAYLDTGRRVPLRGIDDKNLAAVNLHLSTTVASLRQRWIASRGAAWRPIGAVQAKAAEMARYKMGSWVVGLKAFMSAVVMAVVLAVALAILNIEFDLPVFVDGDSALFLPVVLGLVLGTPTIVGILAWITSAVRRRRARRKVGPVGASQTTTAG